MATIVKLGVALLFGLVVFAILVPTSGAGARCFSLAIEVPCDGVVATAAGAVSSGVVAAALWFIGRGRRAPVE